MVVCLSITTEPLSGSAVPNIIEKRVDLPAPLGPTSAIRSPRLILRETSSKSVREPKLFVISDRVSISGQAYAGLSASASFASATYGRFSSGDTFRAEDTGVAKRKGFCFQTS